MTILPTEICPQPNLPLKNMPSRLPLWQKLKTIKLAHNRIVYVWKGDTSSLKKYCRKHLGQKESILQFQYKWTVSRMFFSGWTKKKSTTLYTFICSQLKKDIILKVVSAIDWPLFAALFPNCWIVNLSYISPVCTFCCYFASQEPVVVPLLQ